MLCGKTAPDQVVASRVCAPKPHLGTDSAVRILASDGSETEQLLGGGAVELRARTGRSEPRCRVGGALPQLQGGAGARGRRQVSAGCGSPRLASSRASELGARARRSKSRTTGLLTRVGDNDVLTYKSLQDSTAT